MVISCTNCEGMLMVKLPSSWRLELKENAERLDASSLTLVLPKDETNNEYLNIRKASDYPNLPASISILVLRCIMKKISMIVNDPNSQLIDVDSIERIALSEVGSCFNNLAEYA